MKLTAPQHDRSSGVLLGIACGDALGAGYEYAGALSPSTVVGMLGGGSAHWARGEWTDYTALAVPVAKAVADGLDLQQESTLDLIVAEWVDWANTAPFAGQQLGAALSGSAPSGPRPTAAGVRRAARAQHDRLGRSAGNGCLLRTAPVALAYLDDPDTLADTARVLCELTHCEADAGDACVLWGLAIRHAVLVGELDLRVGLGALPPGRRELWAARIAHAEQRQPADFPRNGWAVQALQGAWSAIVHTDASEATHYRRALEAAVRGGGNADAVAGAAGGLLAAWWGLAAVPTEWRRLVQGWPGLRGADLVRLSVLAAHAHDTNDAGEPEGFRLRAVN